MLRLVESIKVQDGVVYNLEHHQERMDRSLYKLTGEKNRINLAEELIVPAENFTGLYKCRVVYMNSIELVEFLPYVRRDIRSLKLIHADIDYPCKYEDRTGLNSLFAQREECDDILIIKNGLVTDTSSANIVFTDGEAWFTPAAPLLHGTKRNRLIAENKLIERDISAADIEKFSHASIINAMIDPEEILIRTDFIYSSQ
jgi:4-amino-4-deoxychorismate lyase